LTFFSLMIGDKLAGLYAQMLQWGDDPKYFPIHAHRLVKADKDRAPEAHGSYQVLEGREVTARRSSSLARSWNCAAMSRTNYKDGAGNKLKPSEVKNLTDLS
jgi:hypothetical protein